MEHATKRPFTVKHCQITLCMCMFSLPSSIKHPLLFVPSCAVGCAVVIYKVLHARLRAALLEKFWNDEWRWLGYQIETICPTYTTPVKSHDFSRLLRHRPNKSHLAVLCEMKMPLTNFSRAGPAHSHHTRQTFSQAQTTKTKNKKKQWPTTLMILHHNNSNHMTQ